jgi:hypothetical protein
MSSQLSSIDILLKAIFVPKSGQAPKLEIQEKIIYLIAYAVTVLDTEPKNVRIRYNITTTKIPMLMFDSYRMRKSLVFAKS